MHRQAFIVATAGLATLTLSACSTVTDNTVAGRVGDESISYDDVVEILSEESPEGAEDPQSIRGVTSLFIANELVKADLATLGVEVTEPDTTGLPRGEALRTSFSSNVETWQNLPVELLTDAEATAFYSSGSAGLVCTAHVLVETEAEADEVIAELESGRSFAEVAADVSIDPGSGANGGRLGCRTVEDFETTFVPEFVEGARPLAVGEVSGPVESSFGFHVITKITFDELDAQDVFQVRVRHFEDRYDVYVAPRIGEWTETADIIPLG